MGTCRRYGHQFEGAQCPVCKRERTAAWREANKERIRAGKKEWLARNPQWEQEWRDRNKESIAAADKRWRARNPEKARARAVRWRADNIDLVKKREKENRGKAYVELQTGYITKLIRDTTGASASQIPIELVEAKRVEVKLKRLIKELRK